MLKLRRNGRSILLLEEGKEEVVEEEEMKTQTKKKMKKSNRRSHQDRREEPQDQKSGERIISTLLAEPLIRVLSDSYKCEEPRTQSWIILFYLFFLV